MISYGGHNVTEQRNIQSSTERSGAGVSGWPMLLVCLALLAGALFSFFSQDVLGSFAGPVLIIFSVLGVMGFYALQPNEGAVITLFGRYIATDRHMGLRWVLFWYARKKISLRARNVTSETLKVNDKRGNRRRPSLRRAS